MAGMSSATTALVKASIGATALQKVSLGANVIWSAFTAMGMDKSSTFSVPSNTTALVTGWTARTPGSVITGDTLVADGAAEVTVQCKVTLTSAWGTATSLTLRVVKNGTSIGTANIAFNTSATTFTPISTTLAPGDKLALQYTSPFGGSGSVRGGATYTYLYFEQAGQLRRKP